MRSKVPLTFLGQVVRRNEHWKAVRVSVLRLVLDPYLKVYHNKRTHYWASDPEGRCKLEDIVMIKQLDEPITDRIGHYIQKVEFPSGQVTDPITGKRCRGTEFIREDLRRFGPYPEQSSDLS